MKSISEPYIPSNKKKGYTKKNIMMTVYIIDKIYGLTDPPRPYACVSSKEQMEEAVKALKEKEPDAHTVYSVVKIKTLSPDKAEYIVKKENGNWSAKQVHDLPVSLCPQIHIEEEGYLVYERTPESAIEVAKRRMGKTMTESSQK